MSSGIILVTGATGQHGGVGGHAARQLRESGAPVRAMVHRLDSRSHALTQAGIEVVQADFLDLTSLRRAFVGVSKVLFCYPIRPGFLEAALNAAMVAREVEVETFVDLSLIVAKEGSPSDEAREHWLASQMFDWAQINVVHLLGGFFYENLPLLAGADFVARGVLELPFGDGDTPIAWVSSEDVARFAVGVLLQPERYIGGTFYVTGPEALTLRQVADVAAKVFDRPILYRSDISIDAWLDKAKRHQLANPRLLQHMGVLAHALGHMKVSFGKVTDEIERATGRQPISLASFLEAHRADYLHADHP
jgi:NAD(P)H dehydrogenase (quinone)